MILFSEKVVLEEGDSLKGEDDDSDDEEFTAEDEIQGNFVAICIPVW
jgi:hypothetical protein